MFKKLPTKRKVLSVILFILALFVIFVVIMQIHTNSIMREIKAAFYCPDFYVEESRYNPVKYPDLYADPSVNYIVYNYDHNKPNINAHFNITGHSMETKYLDEVNIDLRMHRIFTLHNFTRGKLWIMYTLFVTDKDGNSITASVDIPVEMTIQKSDGKWVVTELYEAP